MEMAFLCKKCKKAFRKDMTGYEESDEYCPNCDNHYVGTMKVFHDFTDLLLGDRGKDC